ncbi:pituitary adenylate cyclase-activating polypeptide type I receptor-like, partial [Carassius auratus]
MRLCVRSLGTIVSRMHRHATRETFLVLFLIISMTWPIHSEISNCVIKREEERCLELIALHDPNDDGKFECPWEWDNLTCWEATSVGKVVEVNCPELFDFMSPEE